ncbi:MAG: hypothetical protein ACRD0U_06125 [Acidimicrobiales bacterium]
MRVFGDGTVVWARWYNPEQADNFTASGAYGPSEHVFQVLDQIGAGEENVPVMFTIMATPGERGASEESAPGDTGTEELAPLEILDLREEAEFAGERRVTWTGCNPNPTVLSSEDISIQLDVFNSETGEFVSQTERPTLADLRTRRGCRRKLRTSDTRPGRVLGNTHAPLVWLDDRATELSRERPRTRRRPLMPVSSGVRV